MEKVATQYPDYKQAVSDFMALAPEAGTLITHEWLDEHLMLDKNDKKYPWRKMTAVADFRRELLEYHYIDLKSLHGKGYYVIPASEQAETAYKDTRKAIQQKMALGIKRAICTNSALLTDEQKKKAERYVNLLVSTQKVIQIEAK